MKYTLQFLTVAFLLISCHKDNNKIQPGCDIQQVYADNAKKVTIPAGIWGTVSDMEGNCMPTVQPSTNTCINCPVKRTVKIYQYTLRANALPSGNSPIFFESFNSPLIAQVDADESGFFQVNIPPGHYSMAVVENGKLYANNSDGQGGLNPFTFTSGIQNINIVMTYKAAF